MPIIANKSENQRKNLAKSRDLSTITFAILQGAQALTLLERRWFSLFIAVAKIEFWGISVSIGELTEHEFRVNHQTRSERSTYRALEGLEKKGFIFRRKFRVGPNKFNTKIYFNESSFRWYLQKSTQNVTPTHTYTHTCTPLPSGQQDLRTKNNGVLLSSSIPNLLDCNRRARTVKQNPKIASYLLPILITLRAMMPGARRIGLGSGAERALILRRAERELSSGDYVSGVDWQYWASRPWKELSHAQRDNIACTEIIPYLVAPDYGKRTKDDRLDKLLSAFKTVREDPIPDPIPREQVASSSPPPDSILDTDEFRVLLEARERGRARSRAG